MSAEARYYYVDAQNQAAGPIAMVGLLALKAAGTVTDSTLVVLEGGSEWVAFSTVKPATASPVAAVRQPAASPTPVSQPPASTSPSSLSAEPLWASQLSQKIDQLNLAMDKLVVALERARPAVGATPVMAPATAALHAEKINLNSSPKPGIAALNSAATPGNLSRPNPMPAGVPTVAPRPGVGTPLTPLAVPANAQKSALPLPALGSVPNPATAAGSAKGNIFSKFLKK